MLFAFAQRFEFVDVWELLLTTIAAVLALLAPRFVIEFGRVLPLLLFADPPHADKSAATAATTDIFKIIDLI
jgi:hypothetical protein